MGAHAASPNLSYFDRLALASWKTVKRVDKSGKHWKPTAMLLLAAKPGQVMNTFMDLSHHHQFMPKVKRARIIRRVGKHEVYALITLDLHWAVGPGWVAVKYSWRKLPGGGYHIKWVRHRGSMRKYWGELTLLPWGRHKTVAIARMQAVPDMNVSRSRLNKGIAWGTTMLVHFLRAEVDRRKAASRLGFFPQ